VRIVLSAEFAILMYSVGQNSTPQSVAYLNRSGPGARTTTGPPCPTYFWRQFCSTSFLSCGHLYTTAHRVIWLRLGKEPTVVPTTAPHWAPPQSTSLYTTL